jgi:hypothetical protein
MSADDEISPAMQARLDELQAEIDRQRAEIAAAREEREREDAAREKASTGSKAKRKLTRAAAPVSPYDETDAAHPEDSFSARWKGSLQAREHIEALDRRDLEAVASRLRVDAQWIPATVVETLRLAVRDPRGWRLAGSSEYLDGEGLEKVVKRAIKRLESRDEEPPAATYSPAPGGGFDYDGILPRRRSPDCDFVVALFGEDETAINRAHAQQLADSMAKADEHEVRAKQVRAEAEAKPIGADALMNAILGG